MKTLEDQLLMETRALREKVKYQEDRIAAYLAREETMLKIIHSLQNRLQQATDGTQ